MSVYLPRQNRQLATNPHCHSKRSPVLRPHIANRIAQLLQEIETFLFTCTYEEQCSFWQALNHLRQNIRTIRRSAIPCFLDCRRKNRDFCRILEVLADLTYPQMHLSNSLDPRLNEQATGRYLSI